MAESIIENINGEYDLSDIKTAKQLREKIDLLKVSIRKDQRELEEALKQVPQHALKASADAVLPSFINKMIANGSWRILRNSAGLLVNPFSKKLSFGKSVVGAAKKLGVLAVVKGAYNVWRNKKGERPSRQRPTIALKTIKASPKPVK